MRIKFFEQRYTWFVVGVPLMCGAIAIAWTVFHLKADKPSADVPSTELFQASASARCSPAGLAQIPKARYC
ncbi:hypothetical protein [Nostoc sp.]